MALRLRWARVGVLLAAVAVVVVLAGLSWPVRAESPPSANGNSTSDATTEDQKKPKKPPAPPLPYWDKGIRLESPKKFLWVKFGGKIYVDGGTIGADGELDQAFPGLEEDDLDFRRLSVSVSGALFYEALDFKVEADFAELTDIKDNWIRLAKLPVLKHLRIGHIKEPFSFATQISANHITFLEKALPNEAFASNRNLGFRYDRTALGQRMTWALGGFFNTGSFRGNAGEVRDRLDDANGFNLTARVTGLPWYEDDGRRLLHLGLSYSYQARDEEIRVRARPETRLTDERLVDTGKFFADHVHLINPEWAVGYGPFSLQGEFFHALVDAEEDVHFWGTYVYGSVVLTGEHRRYSRSGGTFAGITPRQAFQPWKGGWGAWELGLRYSYLDVNDEHIKGGKERNVTVGLNWYLHRYVRLMLNYVHAAVDDRETSPAVEDGSADIIQARFQVAF
jgi:phosphate-selective porin OprO/OprP